MTTINLNRPWQLGKKLASGGFGQVYLATSDAGEEAVIKLIPKLPGAERELLFEDISDKPNVIPNLDYGEWEDVYYF